MKKLLIPIFAVATLWGYGDGVIYWTPHNCDEGKKIYSKYTSSEKNTTHHKQEHSGKKHGGHGGGESAMFALMNLESNASAVLIRPDLSNEPLNFTINTITLPRPKTGGYYAMIAEANTTEYVYSAIRYVSMHGRPAGISPTKLTALSKTALEILPDPLHREHDRYTASKTYRFVAMFEGKPLANTAMTLETHNTPAHSLTTDEKGVVKITLPNDFKNVTPDRNANKPSEFLVTLQHDANAKHYISTFTMPYSANPNDFWQSQEWGAGAIFIGFLGGLLIYRRQSTKGVQRG